MTEQAPETGDRPAPQGARPILVDTSTDPQPPGEQGDQPVASGVFLVREETRPTPTAGAYRAAGYMVPDHDGGPVPDQETPGLVYADQRVAGVVTLVDTPPVLPPPVPEKPVEPAPEAAQPAAPAATEARASSADPPSEPATSGEEGDSAPRRRART